MKTFIFRRHQSGYWGSTPLDTTIRVKAETKEDAEATIRARKDYMKKLANGDWLSWRIEE